MNEQKYTLNKQTGRNYGIDALRIVSMLMVVILHVLGDGGVVKATEPLSLNNEIGLFMEMAVYCAVDCFALISGYVGVYSKYRYSNLCVLWMRVVYYSFGITLIYYLFVPNSMNIKGLMVTALPTFTNKYWYFTAYFFLFLLIPFLNSAIRNMKKRSFQIALVVLVIVLSIIYPMAQILYVDIWYIRDGFSPMWLLVLYLVGGYIRKYGLFTRVKSRWLLLLYFLFTVITWSSILIIHIVTTKVFGNSKSDFMWVSYYSISVLMESVSLLLLFERMKFNKPLTKIISYVSPLAFSVYLIHKHPLIQETFIQDKFLWVAELNPIMMILAVLGIAVGIFVVCILIDSVREALFKVLRLKYFLNYLENRIINHFKKKEIHE